MLLRRAACLVVFVAGMAAAWNNRHHTICPDGKAARLRSAAASSVRSVSTAATTARRDAPRLMRDWWLRALLVLQRPRPVFVALRDDSKESVSDRAEPVLAIVLLAGIAALLPTHDGGTRLDSTTATTVLVVAVWVFLAGSLYGVLRVLRHRRALLYGGRRLSARRAAIAGRATWSRSPPRRSRSRSSLWPVKLALYGESLFRTGGSDRGGAAVFDGWRSGSCSGRRRCS